MQKGIYNSHKSHKTLNASIFCFLCFFLLNNLNILASNQDSIYQLQPVTIESERLFYTELDYFPKFHLKNSIINEIANTVTEAIQFVPGLYLQNYGGMGGLKTVSLRGFTSQNTLILFDGVRLNHTQSGTFNLNKIPEFLIENVIVYRGGNSAFFGNNASAGIVQLNTAFETSNKLILNSSMASYDDYKFHIKVNTELPGMPTSFSIGMNSSKGNYKFLTNQFGNNLHASRTNGYYQQYYSTLKVNKKIGNWYMNASTFVSKSKQGIPGAVVQGKIESTTAKMDEFDILALVNTENKFDSTKSISIAMNANYNYIHFSDPEELNISPLGLDNKYYNKELNFNLRYSTYIHQFKSSFQLESNYATLNGDMLEPDAESFVDRYSSAFAVNLSYDFLNLINGKFSTFLSFRNEYIKKFKPHYSASIGTKFIFSDLPLIIKTATSVNYRIPSFNEMYYLNYGNQNLKSEKSSTISLSFDYAFTRQINSNITFFYSSLQDQIVSIPKNPISWTVKNLSHTENYGIEFNNEIQLFQYINLSLSYTLQNPTDQTPNSPTKGKLISYMPKELLSGYIYFRNSILNPGFRAIYVSHRFSLPDNHYESMLKSYMISNIFLFKEFKFNSIILKTRFEICNLFDTQYEIIKNYPMTGRTWNLTINAEVL